MCSFKLYVFLQKKTVVVQKRAYMYRCLGAGYAVMRDSSCKLLDEFLRQELEVSRLTCRFQVLDKRSRATIAAADPYSLLQLV